MKACFAIVAHVDSGKTSICQKIIEKIYGQKYRDILDNLAVEKERGITVKLKQFVFSYSNSEFFFIDTPGHVQFFSEVERSLYIVENVILVIDTLQGIQSQTSILISILKKQNKKVLVVFNKIDACKDLSIIDESIAYLNEQKLDYSAVNVSAKTGFNLDLMLEKFLEMKPMSLKTDCQGEIFDILPSKFGFFCLVKTYHSFQKGEYIILPNNEKTKILKIVKKYQKDIELNEISEQEICLFLVKPKLNKIGLGKIFLQETKEKINEKDFISKPNMYFQAFPSQNFLPDFTKALNFLIANDPSITIQEFSNNMLGYGYIFGVKGKIHMEIVINRLESLCHFDIVFTNLLGNYRQNGKAIINHQDFDKKLEYEELFFHVFIKYPTSFHSALLGLLRKTRSDILNINNKEEETELLISIAVSQLNKTFYDKIQTITSGYGQIEVLKEEWKKTLVGVLEIAINGNAVEEIGFLCHPDDAFYLGQKIVDNLQNNLEKRNFTYKVQAKFNGRIIVSSAIKALRNDVTAKCYGGDIRRKMKLWEKQAQGRKNQKKNFEQIIDMESIKSIFKTLKE